MLLDNPGLEHWDALAFAAGRGAGKTRRASEITTQFAQENPGARIALAAETLSAARLMVKGESGLLAAAPGWFRPRYVAGAGPVLWPNGAEGHLYWASRPDAARGAQHHFLWGEDAGWAADPGPGRDLWRHLQEGLVLGTRPRTLVTVGPEPVAEVALMLASGRACVAKTTIVVTAGGNRG